MASLFARWYVAKLKSFPMITNIGSGVILMSTGDMLAQRLESNEQLDLSQAGDPQNRCTNADSSVTRRRGSLDIESYVFGYLGMERVDDSPDCEIRSNTSVIAPHELSTSSIAPMSSSSSSHPLSMDELNTAIQSMQDQLAFWKPSRTATMAAWCFFFTPFYVAVYKMYDKYLPRKTPVTIAARVGMSLAFSIPINAAFYLYGTTVNHTIDWYSKLQQQQQEQQSHFVVPYRFDLLIERTRLKIENELLRTITTSATCWVPINLITFSVVPSHLQPLSLMFFSMFWNCYLSMSQYRPVQKNIPS
jgi:hypothetical protein